MTKLSEPEGTPDVIRHTMHPHELKRVEAGGEFQCNGCIQPIDGSWYRCELCDFDLHIDCARPKETLGHPLFQGCTFVFLPAPPASDTERRCVCDACGENVSGFVYHCRERDLDLHPCCALLPERIFIKGGCVFELRKEASRRCGMCGHNGRRRHFWAYRSDYDGGEAYVHVACLRGRSGGDQIDAVITPIMEDVLQSLPRRTGRSGGFDRLRKIVSIVVGAIIAAIFGNPMAMIGAVVGPEGFLR